MDGIGQCWQKVWGRVPKYSINFEEILSRVHGTYEGQNKVLEPSQLL